MVWLYLAGLLVVPDCCPKMLQFTLFLIDRALMFKIDYTFLLGKLPLICGAPLYQQRNEAPLFYQLLPQTRVAPPNQHLKKAYRNEGAEGVAGVEGDERAESDEGDWTVAGMPKMGQIPQKGENEQHLFWETLLWPNSLIFSTVLKTLLLWS